LATVFFTRAGFSYPRGEDVGVRFQPVFNHFSSTLDLLQKIIQEGGRFLCIGFLKGTARIVKGNQVLSKRNEWRHLAASSRFNIQSVPFSLQFILK
jgi:hypothetical protein